MTPLYYALYLNQTKVIELYKDVEPSIEPIFLELDEHYSYDDRLILSQYQSSLGRGYFKQENWRKAGEAYKSVIELLEKIPENERINQHCVALAACSQNKLGQVYFKQENWGKAGEMFRAAIEALKNILKDDHYYWIVLENSISYLVNAQKNTERGRNQEIKVPTVWGILNMCHHGLHFVSDKTTFYVGKIIIERLGKILCSIASIYEESSIEHKIFTWAHSLFVDSADNSLEKKNTILLEIFVGLTTTGQAYQNAKQSFSKLLLILLVVYNKVEYLPNFQCRSYLRDNIKTFENIQKNLIQVEKLINLAASEAGPLLEQIQKLSETNRKLRDENKTLKRKIEGGTEKYDRSYGGKNTGNGLFSSTQENAKKRKRAKNDDTKENKKTKKEDSGTANLSKTGKM